MNSFLLGIAFFVTGTALGAVEWYSSGPGGYVGEPIDSRYNPKSGWKISVERNDGVETQTLYHNNKVQSSIVLTRVDGVLQAWEELDADNRRLSRVEYFYDEDGNNRISYIFNQDSEKPEVHVESQYRTHVNGSNLRSKYGAEDDWSITEMNEFAQTLKQVMYRDDEIVKSQTFIRTEDGRILQSIIHEGDTTRISQYDSQGYLEQEEILKEDVLLLTRSFTWDNANLSSVVERGEGRVSLKEYEWSEEGEKQRETHYENGLKTRDTAWISPGEKIETIFRNGSAVIRVYWKDGRRIKDEFLRYGLVVRERELQE